MYGGVVAEDPRTNWPSRTRRPRSAPTTESWPGRSSTRPRGGRTAAVQDVWAGAAPKPYLVSVLDPYDSISPYHNWGPFRYSRRPSIPSLARASRGGCRPEDDCQTGHAASRGTRKGIDRPDIYLGFHLKVALGLRSTWFRIGVMDLKTAQRQVLSAAGRSDGLVRQVGRPGSSESQKAARGHACGI